MGVRRVHKDNQGGRIVVLVDDFEGNTKNKKLTKARCVICDSKERLVIDKAWTDCWEDQFPEWGEVIKDNEENRF